MKKALLVLTVLAIVLLMVACTPQQKHTHTITGELIVVKEATCAEEGVAHMFCTECGEIVNTVTMPVTNKHTEISIPSVESTCTSTGLTEGKKCSECGEILIEQAEAPLKSHTEKIIPAVEASCTETGLSEGKKCSVCDTVLVSQQETPIVAHTYDDKYDESCNECGFIRDAECAHRETETIKGYDSTCTSTGLTDGEKCKKCGEILVSQTVISVKEHIEVVDEAVEPTCTTAGLTEGKHCGVCGAIIIEQNTINATGHTESDWIIDREATYEAEGSKHIECTVCGAKIKTETIEKLEKLASEGLEFKLNDDGESYSVTGIGSCTDTDIVIPDTHEGLPVTSIGNSAFYSCDSLTSVEIGNSVTSIGDNAFGDCNSLTSIEVDENNENYKSIDGNLYSKDGKTLIQYAIGKEDTSFTIPDSVTSIGDGAFADCYWLTSVDFGDNSQLTSIGDWAFSLCQLITNIEIPDSVTSVGYAAFCECYSLTSIVIPDSVTSIGDAAFADCDSLTIYCEAKSEPNRWERGWNDSNCPVVWGYEGE